MKYYKMLMLLTLVAAGLAAGCSDDEDPLKDWTGPSKPGTEIKTPAEVGNRVVAHRGGSTEAGTRQFPDNSVAALNYAIVHPAVTAVLLPIGPCSGLTDGTVTFHSVPGNFCI